MLPRVGCHDMREKGANGTNLLDKNKFPSCYLCGNLL